MHVEQRQAEIDAEQDAKTDTNKLIWVIAGFIGNFIGILIAYIYQPGPRASQFLEKPEEYKAFYMDTYKIKVRAIQLTYALIGFAILVAGWFIVNLVVLSIIANMASRAA
ncbi:hypothetical protein J5I95_24475 [Candidatus Poribacteria bacterium]|nr:hypothetical protein [Candidatus Poribacteria bacterium]